MSKYDAEISIEGLDKAELLAALYNGSRSQGMGFIHFDPEPWTVEDAEARIERGADDMGHSESKPLYFDYVGGRIIKCDLSGDLMRTWGYNRDIGIGAAERIILALRVWKDGKVAE